MARHGAVGREVMLLSPDPDCWLERGGMARGSRREDLCFSAENSDDEHILYFMKHRTVADK